MWINRQRKFARWDKRKEVPKMGFGEAEERVRLIMSFYMSCCWGLIFNCFCLFSLLIQIWRLTFLSPTGLCPQLSYPMILLQQAGLPPPKRPSSSPMSVATRSTGTLQLPPQKPFGQEASLPLAGEEELPKGGEQDSALEELCKPLYCKLCNVTLNSAQQAQAHYQVRETQVSGLCLFSRCFLTYDRLCLES